MLPVVTIIGLQLGQPPRRRRPDRDGLQPGRRRPGRVRGDRDPRLLVVIQGFVLVIAIVFLVINLLVDISYAYLDPRVRLT